MSRPLPALATLLLLAAFVGSVGAGVIVSDYRVAPDVLSPGGDGLLTVTITNGGGSTQTTGTIVPGGDPVIESVRLHSTDLRLLSGSYEDLGLLGPGQSVPVTFHFTAPSAPGIYFPEVWIRTAQGQIVRYPVVVNVGTRIGQLTRPALVLEKTMPGPVRPGDPFRANLSIANRGSAAATDIVLTVNASAQSLGLESPAIHYIERLEPGEARPITLEFSTDRQVALGLRTIGATLDYVLPDGTPQRQNESFAVLIRGRAELGLAALSIDPVRPTRGDAFSLLVRLQNTGTDDANSVRARIDLPLQGNNESFIGTVEPGNDAPAVFNLVADRTGVLAYTLTATWEDDEGEQTLVEPLTLEVAEGAGNGILILGALVLVALAAVGIWLWRRRSS